MRGRTAAVLLCLSSAAGGALHAQEAAVARSDSSVATAERPAIRSEALDSCPTATFPSVSADPANRRWDDPLLEVECTDTQVVVRSNGIPPYEFQRVTPTDLREQRYVWRFPREAQLADETTSVPLLGPIAIAVNGLPIYGPNEGPHPDPFGDPVYNDILDWCLGHTAQRGDYHYHALVVECLLAGYPDNEPSPVVAWSFDGFPVYGPLECADGTCSELIEVRSGWQQSGDPTTNAWDNYRFVGGESEFVLDPCNGHVGSDGTYHYHATEQFPYILGCYSGFVDPTALRGDRMGGGPPRGRRGPPRRQGDS